MSTGDQQASQYILARRSKSKKWVAIAGCDLGPKSCLARAEHAFIAAGLPNPQKDSSVMVAWGDSLTKQKNYQGRDLSFMNLNETHPAIVAEAAAD